MERRLAVAVLATLALLLPAAEPASAAEDDLRLEAHAHYRVEPDEGQVRVTVDWRATVLKPDTATARYYTDRLVFPIPLEATDLVVRSQGARLRTSVRDTKDMKVVTARFKPLFYKQSRELRAQFTLRSGKPRSKSDIRVGKSFVTFTTWSWGDPDRSSVRVFIPFGFEDEGFGDKLTRVDTQVGWELRSGPIQHPDEWYHVVVATRETDMTANVIQPGGRTVVIRAWPEDPAWRAEVMAVMDDGLPLLDSMIGLPWTLKDALRVFEEHTPVLEGYGGVYDPRSEEIRISEDLDDQTILHEAAHVWLNSGLVDGRWITEGLAEYYADRVREELKLSDEVDPELTDPSAKGAFPLNDWPDPERIDDAETEAQETYGYAAAYTVIESIARDIGDAKLRSVLSVTWEQENAYEGDGAPEMIGAVPDWRQFLDAVEEVGGMEDPDDLFRRFVATPAQIKDLDARDHARAAYARLEEAGDDWAAPKGVRTAMSAWQFPQAEALIKAAAPALAARDAVLASAARLDLDAPQSFENTFEAAGRALELGLLTKDLGDWATAAASVSDATDAVIAERPPLVTLGLIGDSPEASVEAARAALTTGDVATATAAAAAVTATLAGAESVGMTRALIIGGVVLVVVLFLLVAIALIVRRRRRRQVLAIARAGASTTLAASPEPEGARPEVPSTTD